MSPSATYNKTRILLFLKKKKQKDFCSLRSLQENARRAIIGARAQWDSARSITSAQRRRRRYAPIVAVAIWQSHIQEGLCAWHDARMIHRN
jgi:hypothetical protein